MTEAIAQLKLFYAEIAAEHWFFPEYKRAVLSGIKLAISRLEKADAAALKDVKNL